MLKVVNMIKEMGFPFAYDHFAEGESPSPPFICYLIPGSNNFAADGKVYHKINVIHYLTFVVDTDDSWCLLEPLRLFFVFCVTYNPLF